MQSVETIADLLKKPGGNCNRRANGKVALLQEMLKQESNSYLEYMPSAKDEKNGL